MFGRIESWKSPCSADACDAEKEKLGQYATSDVAIEVNGGNAEAAGVPLLGVVGFLEHNWSKKFASALGYSMIDMDNLNGQSSNSFSKGQYIIGNLQYFPTTNVMMVAEYQYGSRDNFEDGWNTSISKVQFSFKYNFNQSFYKKTDSM